MNHHQLLAELVRRGVKVWADGDQLRVRAPKGALTPELRDSLAAQKLEILSSVASMSIEARVPAVPIARISRSGFLPLSSNQQRLWSLAQLRPDSPVYNLSKSLRLTGRLSIPALAQGVGEIVQRHEILRSSFHVMERQVVHSISSGVRAELPVTDLRKLHAAEQQPRIEQLCSAEARRPFDLAHAPLLRVRLLQLEDEEHLLILTVHHLVFDGSSLNIFCRELAALYAAFSSGTPSTLGALPIQYADFAHWEQQLLEHETLSAQLDYWKQQLGGNVAALELPLDRPRHPGQTSLGARQPLVLPGKLAGALRALAQRQESTLYQVLLAAFQTLLHGYSGQEDIIVCSPVSGRRRPETRPLIGFFSRLVPMRTSLSGNPGFRDVLLRVSKVVSGAHEHQDVPLQRLAVLPDLLHTPLARGMFLMQYPAPISEPPGLFAVPVDIHNGAADFDLSLSMEETAAAISGVLDYKPELFDAATIRQMALRFQELLEAIVVNPAQRISDLGQPLRPGRNPRRPAPSAVEPERPSLVAPRNQLERELTDIWRKVFRGKSIGVKDDFFELGGNSLLAVRLLAQVENLCGGRIPIATLLHATTIEQLADLLRQRAWTRLWSSLVAIKPEGTKPPLYFVHGFGGNVMFLRALAAHMDPDQPLYGLQAKGLDGQEAPYRRIEQMAAHYIGTIRAVQPEGPYRIGGFSGGGLVAFEMARQLHAHGQQATQLALIDTFLPDRILRDRSSKLVSRITRHMRNISRLGPGEKLAYVQRRLPHYFRDRHHRLDAANLVARSLYIPQAYPGRATIFCANAGKKDASDGWNKFILGGIRVCSIPGDHVSLLKEPHVRSLASQLQAILDEATDNDIRQLHHRKPGDLPAP